MSFDSQPRLKNTFGKYNYLHNGNFDYLDAFSAQVTGADKWTAFDDGAVSTPVDGTGGSPTVINNAIVSSGQLRGLKSWTLTKTGNAQGEGYSSSFNIDTADKSLPLTISFDYSAGSAYVAGDLVVYVYDITNSVLITPSVISLPVGTGFFQASFNATTATSYRLIFMCTTSSGTTTNWSMTLDNIRVTNEVPVIGAAISDWQTYTPTFTNFTVSASNFVWRRIGDSMQIRGRATLNAAPTGALIVSIPTGYTIDTTKSFSDDEVDPFGTAILRDSGTENEAAFVVYRSTTEVQMRPTEGEILVVATTVPFTWASGDRIGMNFTVPISNWSSNINLAPTSTEYAYNTNVTGSDDTTSFGYGPEGATLPNRTVGTGVSKRIRFKTPISPSDYTTLEVFRPATGGGIWEQMDQSDVGQYFELNGKAYGAHLRGVNSVPTDMDVNFGAGGYSANAAATYGANGNGWDGLAGSTWRWRVRKSSAANVVQVSGTVTGVTDGSNALAGQVGEYKESSIVNNIAVGGSGTWTNITTLSLPPGDWLLQCHAFYNGNESGTTYSNDGRLAISTFSGTTTTDHALADNESRYSRTLVNSGCGSVTWRRSINVTTLFYFKSMFTYSGIAPGVYAKLFAVRIR